MLPNKPSYEKFSIVVQALAALLVIWQWLQPHVAVLNANPLPAAPACAEWVLYDPFAIPVCSSTEKAN